MIKIKTKNITLSALAFLLTSCGSETNEWQSLFNGKNLENWTVKVHHHEVGENFGHTFRAEDNMIKVRYDKYDKFNDQFAHIYYDQEFSNFHLKLEYRFSGEFMEDAPYFAELNSGVMFHSQSPYTMPKEQNWPISVEMQFLADLEDGNPRPTGNMCSPGTDIVYNGRKYPKHCLSSSSETIPKDQWVKAELIVHNDTVTQIINGKTVLEYTSPTIGYTKTVKGAKSELWQEGKALTKGYIALQSEGQPIEFKNIRIKAL